MSQSDQHNQFYDCLIVGGGVAGLSAAIHLAWHKRKVLVLDRRSGPLFFTLTKLENVPGLPSISGVELQKNLLKQAKELGANHHKANVIKVVGEMGSFQLETETGEIHHAKTLLLATGVARYHPLVNGDWQICLKYAAKCNMFYCPDCEAPEVAQKKTLVISTGSSVGGVSTAKHLYNFTKDLDILFTSEDPEKRKLNEEHLQWLDKANIRHSEGKILEIEGKKGCVTSVHLEDGRRLDYDIYFVSSPKVPRSYLAQQLGLKLSASGHIEPKSQRGDTHVAGVWVAGDVRPHDPTGSGGDGHGEYRGGAYRSGVDWV
ncbi:MAG: NAD(P)/FAD-dependent oxidoreductase [Deinococcales bacterium]